MLTTLLLNNIHLYACMHIYRYTCPNGHLYTVGNCTYPMEERRCTADGCNAKIGGQNHVSSGKNKRVNEGDAMFQGTPGYHCSMANNASTSAKGDSKSKEQLCLSDRVMRLLIHALMLASMEIKHTPVPGGNVAKAMSQSRTNGLYIEEVSELFSGDFLKVKRSTGYSEDDAAMGLHLLMASWGACLKENKDSGSGSGTVSSTLILASHTLR
jgi:hypothetical protein